ncbi:MAG: Glycerophosphocholine phosphodiesterase [Chaenotheca gracillima]|nr:MAG: Glycerophosphocholine phosphodiesterase [Chaenotheca gracillima]
MAAMPTIAFIPPSFKDRAAIVPILQIIAAACPPSEFSPAPGKSRMTNHWVLYLMTGEGSAVRLDMSPTGAEDGSGCLIVSKLDGGIPTEEVVKSCVVSLADGATVNILLGVIRDAGHDRYKFSPAGVGCRYWILRTVTLFREKQLATSAAEAEALFAALETVWENDAIRMSEKEQTGMDRGCSY